MSNLSKTKLLTFIDFTKPISYLERSDPKSFSIASSVSLPIMINILSLLNALHAFPQCL